MAYDLLEVESRCDKITPMPAEQAPSVWSLKEREKSGKRSTGAETRAVRKASQADSWSGDKA
jgi:hypothetical protein